MPDTFDRLCARTPLFPPSAAPEPGTILVRNEEDPRVWGQLDYSVILDERRVAVLGPFKGESFFSVKPGEHQVRVRCSLEVSEPLTIRIESGERVELICGRKDAFFTLQLRWMRRIAILSCLLPGLVALIWFAYPPLIGAFARSLGSSRLNPWLLSIAAWSLSAHVYLILGQLRSLRRFRAEQGPGVFLSTLDPQSLKKTCQTGLLDFE